MQRPDLTFKIELFGNLVEQLNYWHQLCDGDDVDPIDHGFDQDECEEEFIKTLSAIKDMREILLGELDEYKRNCKDNNEPVDLSYHRIQVQLKESNFSLFGD